MKKKEKLKKVTLLSDSGSATFQNENIPLVKLLLNKEIIVKFMNPITQNPNNTIPNQVPYTTHYCPKSLTNLRLESCEECPVFNTLNDFEGPAL